jgi:hypothetical protein
LGSGSSHSHALAEKWSSKCRAGTKPSGNSNSLRELLLLLLDIVKVNDSAVEYGATDNRLPDQPEDKPDRE